ncbi:unnamed protein product [Schistosoma margrebowiei]|uniref:Uncharacterized protein n=1 Tax=Schistosoma margrebowiei TaxID=48269 RepID=A0A183NCB2_9TREM|nr:unnamed protein product [Schistosoma margrebowiei]
MHLDNLDFADDFALLSQMQQETQEKTNSLTAASAAVGLNIHKRKSKVLRYNTACIDPITIDRKDLEDVKTFTYFGSIIYEQSRSDADVKARSAKQEQHIYNGGTSGTQCNCQPTPRSGFSIQMSRQFYCIGRKPGELRKPSFRRYRCLLTAVYAKYFRSVGRTLLATTYCGREQTRFHWGKQSGRSAGSG